MSSNRSKNASSRFIRQDLKDKSIRANQTDTANKENVLSDLSAHLAVHAERMKLLKRAEEGLEKLSADLFISRTADCANEKDNLAATKTIETKQDEATKNPEHKKSKLPVSAARQRRREKQEGGKSQIQIKNYRPGYTWNRGGRVKELKIRCLARKFLHIWKQQVFGRVLPSQARYHYNKHIMREVFSEWYDMWWHVRKEWRLMVRAECHFRYLAWTKHFEAWKQFILYKKDENRKLQIAIQYDNVQTLKKTLVIWKSSTLSQRQRTRKKDEATKLYQNNLLKKSWNVWKEKYDLRLHRKNIGVVALQFWAYRLQLQHWLVWCEAYKKRQILYTKEKLALRHHKYYTMQRALTAWINYCNMMKEKKAEKEYAESLYHRSMKVRCMRVWVNHYNRRMMIHNHQSHIDHLADRFTKRRYLQRWLQYVNLEHEKEEKNELAVEHYTRKLKILGLSSFRLHLVQQRMKVMQSNMAANFYVTMLTKRYWNHWMARCEHNEELAIHSLTVKATVHYRRVICRKLLDGWMDYIEWRKHRQAQYDKADAYYYVRAMPVFLGHMKAHVELQKRNREYGEIAVQFRRENLSARFFYMWYNNFEQSREDRMNYRMAILHYEGCIFKRFFSQWNRKHREALEDNKKQMKAVDHFNAVLCRKYIVALKQYLDDLKLGELNDAKATKYNYLHKLSVTFKKWKQYVSYKRQQTVKKNKADMYYRRHVYQRVMKKLKNNLIQGRQFRQIADVQYTIKCQHLVRWALLTWKENCEEQKEEKESEQMAICHYHKCLYNKVLKSWHRYAVIHAYKKSETNKWVENTQKILNHNKLQRYFSFWKQSRDDSLLSRLKREQASQHYNRVVLQHLIIQWKQFVQVSVKKRLLMKQSVWFNEVRLKTWSLSVWKGEHCKAQETVRKSALALWHWSLTLQKQMLIRWYMYSQYRKRKKCRINQAIERRRNRLVKNGIIQWLSVANDLSGLRAKFAAQQHATKAFTLHQIVQKCALHWRQWAARKKLHHGGQTKMSVNHSIRPRVDFMVRPSPCIPDLIEQPVRQKIPVPMASESPVLSKEVITERLVPTASASPSKPKGQVPGEIPSKHVEFKLDRNIPSRRKPRHPSFLAESLKRAGLFSLEQECFESNDTSTNRKTGQYSADIHPDFDTSVIPMETTPKIKECVFETSNDLLISKPSDKNNLEEFPSKENKSDQTSGIIDSENSGQTTGMIGSDSTLQVRGFCEKLLMEDRTQTDSENLTQQTEKTLSSITSDVNIENKYNIPKQGYKTFETKLLTPADFLATKLTSTLTKDAVGVLPSVGLSPRNVERVEEFSSINSTLKSKESVDLLSTGNDSAKLKESFGFVKSADNTTPRSADSLFPINPYSPRAEKRGTVLANQITDIRNRLKGFNKKKKRLRKLQKQHVHLSEWLEQEIKKGQEIETEVIKKEIIEIEEETRKLNQEIDIEKPMCTKLVSEVQILVNLLQGSETS